MQTAKFTDRLKQAAIDEGFALVGACPAVKPRGVSALADWLAAGYAGEMTYIADRQTAYEHPRHVLDGARSLLMLGMPYETSAATEVGAGEGRVARYAALPHDYHDDIHARLKQLRRFALELRPGIKARGVVDTAPLLEREFAQLAGLGWVGKNTMLLNRQHGSWFFLAALLLDCELQYDDPMQTNHCGTCTACLDACPTQAFPKPYVLDATRCISYLTIELRDNIPPELRPDIGDWLFGCDICQEVCPWNYHAARVHRSADSEPTTPLPTPSLTTLFELTDDDFRHQFRRTAFWRSRRRGLLRNAAIVLGNQRSPTAIPALTLGLHDCEPLVRTAAAWALGQIGTPDALNELRQRLLNEDNPQVVFEISRAIS